MQLALGHSTSTITLNTYVGEWPDTDQETRTIMDAALGQVPGYVLRRCVIDERPGSYPDAHVRGLLVQLNALTPRDRTSFARASTYARAAVGPPKTRKLRRMLCGGPDMAYA